MIALAFLAIISIGVTTGCFSPDVGVDEVRDGEQRPAELFVPDADPTVIVCDPDPSPLSVMRIRVRTSNLGGRFMPRNVGAIWIEDAAGGFVKTVQRWGETRAKWLWRFQEASAGDVTDAITGATLPVHQTHEPSWDLTDLTGCEISDGDYQVVFEVTDRSGPGASHAVPFAKGPSPTTITPADAEHFHELQLTLE